MMSIPTNNLKLAVEMATRVETALAKRVGDQPEVRMRGCSELENRRGHLSRNPRAADHGGTRTKRERHSPGIFQAGRVLYRNSVVRRMLHAAKYCADEYLSRKYYARMQLLRENKRVTSTRIYNVFLAERTLNCPPKTNTTR